MNRQLLLIFLFSFGSFILCAQEAEISGTIVDNQGESLIGCSVRVVGSVIGATTDVNGKFHLSVPPGRIRLLASYIGYENFDTTLVVSTTDREFELEIVLDDSFVTGGEVIVIGRRAVGQAQALREQQSSMNQQTILHSELFNKYPDVTLAETVQRMPGVTLTRNRGQGEQIQVRGLPEQYTAISLNGQRLPVVQPEADRAGSLDVIQSNLVEEVRVVKTRSPDMDGDAIGGTVDFRIREPEEQLEVILQGGVGTNFGFDQNPNQSAGITQLAAVLNSELNEETVYGLLAGSYFRHARGNRTLRYDYGEDGVTGTRISRARPIDTDQITTKTGLIGAIELRPSIYNRLRLSYNYSLVSDDIFTREVNFSRDFQPREDRIASKWKEERGLSMVTLEVENNFKDFQLEYNLSFANTREQLFDRQRAFNTLVYNPGEGLSDDEFASLNATDSQASGSLPRRSTEQHGLDLQEDIAIGNINLIRYISNSRTSYLKTGARYRIKDRNYREYFARQGTGSGPAVPAGGFADLGEEPRIVENPDLNSGPNYTAQERIAAGYLMYVANWNANFTSSVGARYEYTSFEYFLSQSERADSFNYNNLFPSINLTFRLRRDRQFRLGYYEAIARVPYATLVPTQRFNERRLTELDVFAISNSDIEPTYSRNFDLSFERYGRNDGLFTVGVFAKFLRDPTIRTAEFAYVNEHPSLGYSLMNIPDASILGFEANFYQSLAPLNQSLRHFNINGNVNANLYNLGEDENNISTLAQAPRRSANLSFVYSNPENRFNVVLAGNYRSSTLDLLQDGQEIWIKSVISLDIAADYELFRGFSAYTRLNNITDHGFERSIGKPDDDGSLITSVTQYGTWGVIGLRYRPAGRPE